MEKRGRGSARGRARGGFREGGQEASRPGPRQAPQQTQTAWAARPGGPQQGPPQQRPPQGPPQQRPPQQGPPGAWSGRPQAPPQQQPPQQAWAARPPGPEMHQQSVGRGSRKGGGDDKSVTGDTHRVAQGGDAGLTDKRGGGNGGVRGRTNRNEIISTKPSHVETKKGVDGTAIRLRGNYFPLLSATKWGLNQYRVDFSPNIEDTRTRRKLFAIGIRPFNVTGYLFDGTVVYTPNRLHPEPCEFVVPDESNENQPVSVQVRLVGEVHWGDFHYFQLFNIIVRKCFTHMQFQLLGRNYFDPQMKVVLRDHNLEIWPGFLTSMRQYEQQIMLNIDLSFKVLRRDRVFDILMECQQGRNPKLEFQNRVIGSIVLTAYNNKTYRVDDIDFNRGPDSTFAKRDGTQVSFRQYFQDRYNLKVSNEQPLLISKSKAREIRAGMPELVVLLPEFCIMTGLTDKQRENMQLMKAMGEHTRVNAGERMRKLLQFAERLRACPQAVEEVKRWDFNLADNLIEFEGRVLPQETLLLRNNQPIYGGEEADWTKTLRLGPMFSVVNIDKLAVISPHRMGHEANEFGRTLQRVAKGMSMHINFKLFEIGDDKSQSYLSELEKLISTMSPDMVLVVLPNNSGDRYNAIKKKCYVDRAMPCQIVVGRTLNNKGVMSIATKVAIQMNCKMGGAPWGTSMPKHIMVCGYDVCRDTANKSKSFAGMVASMDGACTRFFNMAVEHEAEQELSSNIAAFMQLACKQYQEINGVLPQRILVYRDGVGDGQIPYVKEHEVELIKEKLGAELYRDQPLRMAFVVVSKRINTKIFRSKPNQRNDFNPPPGTVVDDVITWPERYDFYIISQCVRQGTVAPTSYNVIEDTLGIDANKIQRFTFKMCHMYFNWSGTVRVPAPCQYAHKLAFMTAQSLHRPANAALKNTLYYL